MFRRLLVLAAFASFTCSAYSENLIPNTRAGIVLTEMLAAFNRQDKDSIEVFRSKYHFTSLSTNEISGLASMSGGFHLVRIENSQPSQVQALIQENTSEQFARVTLVVTEDGAPVLVRDNITPISTPKDLAPRRLALSDAVGDLKSFASTLESKDRFSGVLLVAQGSDVLLHNAYGLQDRDSGRSVSPDTRFRIGSIYKSFTAIAILQLVEAGKIGLDDKVGRFLVDYPNKDMAEQVTVRHLLTHTGGTGDIFGPDFERNRLALKDHSDYIRLYGARDVFFTPGSKYSYSNYGFILLAAIIEKASGVSYDEYLEKHVFAVAKMMDTGRLSEPNIAPPPAIGYTNREGNWVSTASTLPFRGTAAGGGYSTAKDLLRFAQALQAGKLISKEALSAATSEKNAGYGYGFQLTQVGDSVAFGHGGGAPGISCELKIFPNSGLTVLVLSNQDGRPAYLIMEHFMARMPLVN